MKRAKRRRNENPLQPYDRERQKKGKHHKCGEEDHRARDCRAPKDAPAIARATQKLSDVAKPKTSPADATHTANFEGEDSSLAEEGASHAAIIVVEADLSCWYAKARTQVPAQIKWRITRGDIK